MSIYRFFAQGAAVGERVELPKEDLRHARVLRIREGEQIELLGGQGEVWAGVWEKEGVRIQKISTAEKQKNEIILVVGVTQGGTMEDIVKQATEMGVRKIIPLRCERGGVGVDEKRAESKRERWEKIVEEACKQSGNRWKPEVTPFSGMKDVLAQSAEALHIVAALDEEQIEWKDLGVKDAAKIFIWIGPEGDFSKEEYVELKKNGAKFVSLGETVLRVQTACVVAIAMVKAFGWR